MATLRPTKDLRSISVNEFSTTSTKSKKPIPTPFLRQPSVVEVLEKKQREGLKNRLKLLHTGAVLPSRKPVSKTLPVIVKEPVRKMTLPKNPPRKAAHYRSVLTLAAEPEGDPTTASHMTRRHSVGGLICTYGSKERLSSDRSNGTDFKSQTLPAGLSGFSLNKYGSTNADSRHKSDPADTRPKSRLPTAKDDNYLNKNSSSSSIGSFQPISKTQSQILTNIAERNEFKDAKTKGNYRRHEIEDEEEDVFSSPRTKVDLDENFNVKVQNKANDRGLKDITDKPDTSYLVNSHKDVTTKIKLDSDIVVTMKTMPLTNSTRPRSTDEFLMTELRSEGTGGTHPNKDKEQPRSMFTAGLESSTLLDFDDSVSTTPSSHKHDKNDESLLEKSSQQQHTLATTAHFPDFGNSNQEHTEAYVTPGKVVISKKLESEIPDGRQFSDDAFSKIKVLTTTSGNHDFSDDLKELKKIDDKSKDGADDFWSTFDASFTGPAKTTTSNNSELIDIEFQKSPHAGLDNYNSSGIEKNTSKPSDALWSTFEDSFTGSVQSTPNKSYSEPVEADIHKRWDAAGLGKHNFSDDLKELIKSDTASTGGSDSGFQWSGNDDSLTGTIETASSIKTSRSESIEGKFHDSPDTTNHGRSYFSDDLRETNKNDDKSEGKANTLWPSTGDSLAGSVQTILSSSPTDVGIEKKRPDSGLGKPNISDDLNELKKIDDKGKDKLDGLQSVVDHSYTGSVQTTTTTTKATTAATTSKQELIEVEVQKCPDAGLGFCIEGGKESALGDRPVTVKRVFNAATQRCLKEGDEILTVCGKETSTLTRIDAWKLFKSLPDGSVKMTIIRRME